MEHVVFEERENCTKCEGTQVAVGKVLGVELTDWRGHKIKVTLYYRFCPSCNWYQIRE